MAIAITDPALLERQTMADERFIKHFIELIANFPPRAWDQEAFERGLRYPWYRPERSYLLRDDTVTLLHDLEPDERSAIVEQHIGPASGREALVAFGSNAAPKNLALKLAHHPDPEDREVLVLSGELSDLDVVASASVAVYGAMPATITASAGTSVNAALLFVNVTQLTALTWGELPYRIGRLRGAPFIVEEGIEGLEVDSPLAFVSRWGAFLPEGEPAPLAAVPGRNRRSRAWTQLELLQRVADILLGPGNGGPEALVRTGWSDIGAMAARVLPTLREHSEPFEFPGWDPIGPDGRL